VPKVTFDPSLLPGPPCADKPEIILHPFSAIAEREVDPQVFIDIANAFADDYQIVMTAGPNDLARAPRHQALADHAGVVVDTSDLKSKAARLRGAALVVSVDTSIMHLAVGMGAPTICLASAAHIVDSVPYDSRMIPENVTFMVPEIDCAGCLGQCIHPLEGGRYRCLGQLTTDIVLSKAQEILAAQPRTD
jgi:ADP-heptose:LPS heptosyltransferase